MRNRVRKKILKAKIVDTQQKSGYAKVSEGTWNEEGETRSTYCSQNWTGFCVKLVYLAHLRPDGKDKKALLTQLLQERQNSAGELAQSQSYLELSCPITMLHFH